MHLTSHHKPMFRMEQVLLNALTIHQREREREILWPHTQLDQSKRPGVTNFLKKDLYGKSYLFSYWNLHRVCSSQFTTSINLQIYRLLYPFIGIKSYRIRHVMHEAAAAVEGYKCLTFDEGRCFSRIQFKSTKAKLISTFNKNNVC